MNSHTKLLLLLDDVFGPRKKLKSTFRKVRQEYDERTEEHVVVIEYRVREKGALATTPQGRETGEAQLIRQLNSIVNRSSFEASGG